jgi:CRP-like cAMP-binding protein
MDHTDCECPLASKFCRKANLLRQRWFNAVKAQDLGAMEKLVKLTGSGKIPHELASLAEHEEGLTALHIAARDNLQDVIQLLVGLLKEQEFVQSVLDFPQVGTLATPLCEACRCGNLEAVEILCRAGAKWYLPDAKGVQPRKHAEQAGNLEIVAFLEAQALANKKEEAVVPQADLADGHEAVEDTDAPDIAETVEIDEGVGTDSQEPEDGEAAAPDSDLQPPSGTPSADEAGDGQSNAGVQPTPEVVEELERPETPITYLSPRLEEEVMRVLCNVSFFPSMDAPSLKELSRLCSQSMLLKGETLQKGEDETESMYIVVEGKILAFVEQLEPIAPHPDRPWSIRHRLKNRSYRRRLTDNDCFGENILLIGDKMRFKMEAEEDTKFLELNRRAFKRFIQHHLRITPELGAFLAGQLVDASDAIDDSHQADLAREMQVRICKLYNLPDKEEEVENLKRSTARAIVEVPLAEPNAKHGINVAHRSFASHSKFTRTSHGEEPKDDGSGYFPYLRVCDEMSIRPSKVILLALKSAHIRLDNMGLTIKDGLAVAGALCGNTIVRSLNLSGNRLYNDAFTGIREGRIEKITTSNKGILDAIAEKPTQYEEINLERTYLGKCTVFGNRHLNKHAIGVLSRISEFNTAKALVALKLGSNFLGCSGVAAISEALARNYTSCKLTYLDVSNNGIANAGATALGKMLESNHSLIELDVGWNHVSEAGSVAFFEGMVDNESINKLHFGWNRIGVRGGKSLGRMFFHNKTLSHIDLQNCGIVSEACPPFADGLKGNQSLACIKLQWNPMGQGCKLLMDVLMSMSTKPLFNLENCSYNSLSEGKSSTVEMVNLTQSYRFDLSDEKDRQSLQHLMELALKEGGQNWRNERLNGKAFHFPEEGIWNLPDEGVLEFDFVDSEPVTDDTEVMSMENFRAFIQQLGRIFSSDGRIEMIKQATYSFTFNHEQVIVAMGQLPRSIEKEEALVYFFSRMHKRQQHMPTVLLRCWKRPEIVNLQRRLGPGKVFDAYRPAGPYVLVISKADDRAVLQQLKNMKAEGKFNGSDCRFGFSRGLLRGFHGEIIDSAIDVEDIDLEALAQQTRAWAREDSPQSEEDNPMSRTGSTKPEEEAGDEENDDVPLPPPRRHTLSFEFQVLEMQKADMKAVFRSIGKKDHLSSSAKKLPPIDVDTPVEADEDDRPADRVLHSDKKKKKSPAKKVLRMLGVQDEPEQEEDLDRKSIFPFPRTAEDLQHIKQTKDFTAFTDLRRSAANGKAHKMIDETFVRSKHVTVKGLKLRGGAKKWRPWATFSRSHKQDFDVHPIHITGGSKGAGRIHEVVQGALGEASCLNYSVDLMLPITLHTIPRVINFWVSSRPRGRTTSHTQNNDSTLSQSSNDLELSLYANTSGLPCAQDFIWQGQQTATGDLFISIRPNDTNYIAGTYFLSLITERYACDFDLHVQVIPFSHILDELDTDMKGQPLPGKARHVDHRVKLVKELRAKTADMERVFFDITTKSSKRVLKGSIGAPMPEKPQMRFRPDTGKGSVVGERDRAKSALGPGLEE